MDAARLKALRATMPWRHQTFQESKGRVRVQLVDKEGREVPLFDMLEVLETLSIKLATTLE